MKKGELILVVALLLSVASGWAQSGTCGANLTWRLSGASDNYTLTISGSGAMDDYTNNYAVGVDIDFDNPAPWSYYQSSIMAVIIGDSVTTIGNWAFFGFSALTCKIRSIPPQESRKKVNDFGLKKG